MNREFKKSHDKKTKALKLRDLTPQKDAKGGAGKASAQSSGVTSTVPTSLDEFLKTRFLIDQALSVQAAANAAANATIIIFTIVTPGVRGDHAAIPSHP